MPTIKYKATKEVLQQVQVYTETQLKKFKTNHLPEMLSISQELSRLDIPHMQIYKENSNLLQKEIDKRATAVKV